LDTYTTCIACTLALVLFALVPFFTASAAERPDRFLRVDPPEGEETVMVAAVIPTYTETVGGSLRPFIIDETNSVKYRDYWQIPVPGDEYSPDQPLDQVRWSIDRAIGPPKWLDGVENHPQSGYFYYKLPARLIVSASDGVAPNDLPDNIRVRTTSGSAKIIDVRGVPSEIDSEGIYEFSVVMTDNGAGQTVALNHVGSLRVTADVPSSSPLHDALPDGQGNAVSASPSVPFGTKFRPSLKLASALEEGYQQLRLLMSATQIAYKSQITAISTGARVFSVLAKKAATKVAKKFGSAVVKKAYHRGREILLDDGSDVDLSEAEYVDGSVVIGKTSGSNQNVNWGGPYFLLRDRPEAPSVGDSTPQGNLDVIPSGGDDPRVTVKYGARDRDRDDLECRVDFGDGRQRRVGCNARKPAPTPTPNNVLHSYASSGRYTVRLIVSDGTSTQTFSETVKVGSTDREPGWGGFYRVPTPAPDYLNKACLRGDNFGFEPPNPRLVVHKYDTDNNCRIDNGEVNEATSDWAQNQSFSTEQYQLVIDAKEWSSEN
jgi:hypothetical protein